MTAGPRNKRGRPQPAVSAKKKRNAPFKGPDVPDEAKVRTAFARYLKFREALGLAFSDRSRREDWSDLWERQYEEEAALIVALAKIWREWKGTSPRTVGTDTSKLGAGKFPFGEWIVELFKVYAEGEHPPSRYAIHKAIRSRR
jgi:hypothetical protein